MSPRPFALSLACACVVNLMAAMPARAQVTLGGHTFTLPKGFEIELVAGPPLVDRPITVDFDEQGRLYVAESSGSNDKVDKQLAEKPHRILRLEDTDGDGRFDRRTVFADKMMFPEGTLWYAGSLYVAAPPSIWKLTDTDGDGVADQRVEWFQGKTLGNCANDLHGPYLGHDGWIYWCKGAFAEQKYERPGKPPFVTRASHIFRSRPDASGIESVMTGGMDNPVDVVFTPAGERIFTTTFFQQPGGGKRDGMIHAVYGGVYGKVHDVIEGHPRTRRDVMPPLTHMGPAAPCGLACYESDALGPGFAGNIFCAQFNLQKVSRHVLKLEGATFVTEDSDFVVSTNRDFHPTDVLEDADGSLLVVDTGGWYKLCCPTSQLSKPDVFGGIYRVRKTGASAVRDPRGLLLAWKDLKPNDLELLLGDPRPAVRQRATAALAALGAEAIPHLAAIRRAAPRATALPSIQAVWTASRIDHADARALVRGALHDPNETVLTAAAHVAGLWRDKHAVGGLRALLKHASLHVRRAAAEALGRTGDKSAVPAILEAAGANTDPTLAHSLTYALIEVGDRAGTVAGLADKRPAAQLAALVALDQMPNGNLTAEQVTPLFAPRDPALADAAMWVLTRHAEWGQTLVELLRERVRKPGQSNTERRALEAQMAQLAKTPVVQAFLAETASNGDDANQERVSALRAMSMAGLRETPGLWIATIQGALTSPDAEMLRSAVAAARGIQVPKNRTEPSSLRVSLLQVAERARTPADVRLDALAAMPGGAGEVSEPAFDFLRGELAAERPALTRTTAADVLGKARLSTEQLRVLAGSLATAGPMEIDRLIAAYEGASDEAVGLAAVAALRKSPALAALRVESVQPRLAKFNAQVKKEAEALYAAIRAEQKQQHARLEELLGSLAEGDVRRGQAVFNSQKAACASCHAIGYLGGNIGPDLTRIGQIRQQRDLLEAILYPSASFVRSYEPWTAVTVDGKIFTGVLRNEGQHEITLVKAPREEFHILRADIEELQPGTVSIMPAGLDKQLNPQELADLLAFLRACK